MKKNLFLALFVAMSSLTIAKVPTPPEGKRWVLNAQYSDEFNGNKLDNTKWNNTFNGWKGRKPAWFNPDAVSVADGNLKIRTGVLSLPIDGYTIYGGAVQSNKSEAFYGYYECSFKASQVPLSATFWLSNSKEPLKIDEHKCSNGKYPNFSQELDIQECVGLVTGGNKSFDQYMHSNTHFRIVKCGESKETFLSKGANTKIDKKVNEIYNTYGCWWVDSKKAMFYANDEYFQSVDFSTDYSDNPFPRPMRVNMVVETYDWNPCSKETHGTILEDLTKNTSYYDWVRSWYLVDIDAAIDFDGEMPLDEEIVFYEVPNFYSSTRKLRLQYQYQAKLDRTLKIKIIDKDNQLLETMSRNILAGSGKVRQEDFQSVNNFGGNGPYRVVVEICDKTNGVVMATTSSNLGDIILGVNDDEVNADFFIAPNPAKDRIEVKHAYNGVFELYDTAGRLVLVHKSDDLVTNITLQNMNSGVYFLQLKSDNKRSAIQKVIVQ